ncbi:MAG: hypothetical protein IKJ01_04395 [Lachnospiraceae bacterium]|nr:hypothetical protein [Lachnospiraceae bacterium]
MKKNTILTTRDIALIGMMVAVIEVCKTVFSFLPNIELTSFWIIMFSLYFGKKIYFAIPVFILLEAAIYGIGLWWIMYLYAWPLLAVITRLFRNMDSVVSWAIVSGIFGLLFGFLCAIPYIFIGANLTVGLQSAFAWWIAGIPWDIVHGISNFLIMLVLYRPIAKVMKVLKQTEDKR